LGIAYPLPQLLELNTQIAILVVTIQKSNDFFLNLEIEEIGMFVVNPVES